MTLRLASYIPSRQQHAPALAAPPKWLCTQVVVFVPVSFLQTLTKLLQWKYANHLDHHRRLTSVKCEESKRDVRNHQNEKSMQRTRIFNRFSAHVPVTLTSSASNAALIFSWQVVTTEVSGSLVLMNRAVPTDRGMDFPTPKVGALVENARTAAENIMNKRV